MGKVKSPKVNYATPGDVIDQQEFEQMIRKAESGPFHSIKSGKSEVAKRKAKNLKMST
ncbi:MAG: hypothetical protein ABI367_07330 [Mucilaginibacter sp.]